METVHYLRALARSWFIVIITIVAGGAGGYYVYHRATPLYQTSVRMIASGSQTGQPVDEVTARVLAVQRAAALAQVAATAPAIKAAAAAAGYRGDVPSVSASSDKDGPFLTVTVTDTEPKRAKAIADAFAQILPSTMTRLEGQTDTSVSVSNLAPAGLPTDPTSPDLENDLGLGLAAGLILGLAVALLREVIDRTVRDSDELERISDLTVLGIVPRDLPKIALPVATNPRSVRAEAYRQIRTTLLNTARPITTLAVTSASVGEGKTSVATNLAIGFSRAGHRVAIVDADMRRPRVASVLGMSSRSGLSDVLARRISLDEALTYTDDGRLAVLGSGPIPANPSEALGGGMMEDVLARLAAAFEFVIVDTPPVLPVTDALVVAPMVDGVLLVTRLGRTTREQVRRAKAAVGRVNAELIGIVPNQAGKGTDRDYRYGYKYAASHKKGESPAEIDADLLKPATHSQGGDPVGPAQPLAGPAPQSAPSLAGYEAQWTPPFAGYEAPSAPPAAAVAGNGVPQDVPAVGGGQPAEGKHAAAPVTNLPPPEGLWPQGPWNGQTGA